MAKLNKKLEELTDDLKQAGPRAAFIRGLAAAVAPTSENVSPDQPSPRSRPTPKRKRSARIISSRQKAPRTPPAGKG